MSTEASAPVMMMDDQFQQSLQHLPHAKTSRTPKMKDPEFLYHGAPTKLRSFITWCELTFACEPEVFDTDAKKVKYAISGCRGKARSWINQRKAQGRGNYNTWEDFKTAISQAFSDSKARDVARRKFRTIKQGNRTASEYWMDFQSIIMDLGYNDAAYIDQFEDGLCRDVQLQIALSETRPTTMTEFAYKAIALDNRLV